MAKKISAKGKKGYATYKALDSFKKNKLRKIARHLKNFPDDLIAQDALKAAKSATYSRKASNTRSGWVDRRNERYIKATHEEARNIAQVIRHEKKVRNVEQYDKAVQEIQRKLNDSQSTNHAPKTNPRKHHHKSKKPV